MCFGGLDAVVNITVWENGKPPNLVFNLNECHKAHF